MPLTVFDSQHLRTQASVSDACFALARLFVSFRDDGVEVKLQKETMTRREAEGEWCPLLVAKLFGARVGIDAVFDLQHAPRLEFSPVGDVGA